MPDSSLPTGPLEVVKAFVKAAAFDRDEAACRALLVKGAGGEGSLNPPPDAHEMTYEYGEVKEENGEWFVPVTIINPKDSNQPPMALQFAPVLEDGQWKLDMNKMMERMLGGGMAKVMEGMADAMKGVGEAMADGLNQAFEGIGDAMSGMFDSSQDTNLNKLPDGSSPDLEAVFRKFNDEDLPDQLALMREALGNELGFYVDWYTFNDNAEAAAELTNKVLHNLRSAICLSSSEDKVRDGLREKLREVLVLHSNYEMGKILNMQRGRLQITTCLTEPGGAHSASEIMAALREGLDADKKPAIDRLINEIIPQLKEQIGQNLDLGLEIEIDLASFTQGFDTDTAVRNLKKLEDDVLRNFLYVLREVNGKMPLGGSVFGLRFEHVPRASQRAVFVHGSKIVFRMCFTEEDGCYYASDLEQLLPAVAAAAPDFSDKTARYGYDAENDTPTENTAFARIGEYRDYNMQELTGNIQAAVGRGLGFGVDWASFGEDAAAAEQLKWWGFNRVYGAARFIARDPAAQQDMTDMINGFTLTNVATPEEKRIEIAGGKVDIYACFAEGEKGCFYDREIADNILAALGTELRPMIAGIREGAQAWEKHFLEEYGATVRYNIDFAGFTSSPDDNQNRFALSLLKEHGVDAIFYAIIGLFEKNPNFKQQFLQRVRRLNVLQVPDPSQKQANSYDDSISYYCYLHEGYKGYLTIDELKKLLPAIIAEMKDIDDSPQNELEEEMASRATSDATSEEMTLAGAFAEADPIGDDPNASAFAEVRAGIEQMLPNFTQQFVATVGKPIAIDIDWDSLGGDPLAMGQILNICLSPILGGMMMAGQDAGYRDGIAEYIDRITLQRVRAEGDQALRLDEGTLTMAVCIEQEQMPTMDAEQAAAIFKGMIDHVRAAQAEPAETPKPRAKEKAATKPKPAAKKPEPKAKAKPAAKAAEKPKAKGKAADKGKGASKNKGKK